MKPVTVPLTNDENLCHDATHSIYTEIKCLRYILVLYAAVFIRLFLSLSPLVTDRPDIATRPTFNPLSLSDKLLYFSRVLIRSNKFQFYVFVRGLQSTEFLINQHSLF